MPFQKSKICSKCGIDKPIADFLPDKNSKDGFGGHCKQCRRVYNTLWRRLKRAGKSSIDEKCTASLDTLDQVGEAIREIAELQGYINKINTEHEIVVKRLMIERDEFLSPLLAHQIAVKALIADYMGKIWKKGIL